MRTIGLFLLALCIGSVVVTAQDDADKDLKKRIRDLEDILNRRAKRQPVPQDKFLITRAYDVADLSGKNLDQRMAMANLLPSNYAPSERDVEEPRSPFQVDMLIELIRSTIEPDTWDELEGASIEPKNNRLFVTTAGRVHARIARLIATLRTHVRQVVVDVVAVAVTKQAAALLAERPRELSAEDAAALGKAGLLGTARVICADGQSQFQRNGRSSGYIQDYEVKIAQEAAIGYPIRHEVFEGCAAEVRGCLDQAGNGVVLFLRIERTKVKKPMRQVVTEHGKIDTPDMALTRIGTALWAPLGKTIVVGGATAGADPCVFLVTARLAK